LLEATAAASWAENIAIRAYDALFLFKDPLRRKIAKRNL
jgi:hypothetical protein